MTETPELRFRKWLCHNGVDPLRLTNPFEWSRFRYGSQTYVIYLLKGVFRFSSPKAEEIFLLYSTGKPLPRPKHKLRATTKNKLVTELLHRDGNKCIYCARGFLRSPQARILTVEHFLPRVNLGPDTLANTGLACQECNTALSGKSVAEKIKYALNKHGAFP